MYFNSKKRERRSNLFNLLHKKKKQNPGYLLGLWQGWFEPKLQEMNTSNCSRTK
jgi:hypothetical protein